MAIDLNNIKTQFKTILDAANTTTADYDLSQGMNSRVSRVLKVNPLKIPVQPSFFPYVTIYTDFKSVEFDTIAKNQIVAKRMADVTFSVIGAVWEQIILDVDEDEADEEIERLMENIEELVRRNYRLNDTIKWSKPRNISYHSLSLDEETHMRIGLLNLECKIQY